MDKSKLKKVIEYFVKKEVGKQIKPLLKEIVHLREQLQREEKKLIQESTQVNLSNGSSFYDDDLEGASPEMKFRRKFKKSQPQENNYAEKILGEMGVSIDPQKIEEDYVEEDPMSHATKKLASKKDYSGFLKKMEEAKNRTHIPEPIKIAEPDIVKNPQGKPQPEKSQAPTNQYETFFDDLDGPISDNGGPPAPNKIGE